jgi:hypothetical protein
MTIEITKILPAAPLDPYKPFEIHYKIVNGSAAPLEIPDLQNLQLRVTSATAETVMERSMAPPKTFEMLQTDERRKKRENPQPIIVKPKSAHAGVFRTLDAFAPLPGKIIKVRLQLPLNGSSSLVSDAAEVRVQELPPLLVRSISFLESVSQTRLRQQVRVLAGGREKRWVFISSLYPEFDSIVMDGKAPAGAGEPLLPAYWPGNRIKLHLAAAMKGSIGIFEVANPPPYDISNRLALVETVPLSDGTTLLGLVHVTVDENGMGVSDILLILERPRLTESSAGRRIAAEYWRRDRAASRWQRTVIAEREAGPGNANIHFSYNAGGIRVEITGGSPIELDLASGLGAYRTAAANSAAPAIRATSGR